MPSVYRIILLVVMLFFVGCQNSTSHSGATSVLLNINISNDCAFWFEESHNGSTLRAGVSGACRDLSLSEYARVLDASFVQVKDNGFDLGQVDLFYLNAHEGSVGMGVELVRQIDRSESWTSDCVGVRLDECFNSFNLQSNYFEPIEKVFVKNFKKKFISSFKGVMCFPKKNVASELNIASETLKKKCYPTSFGLAIFKVK